MFMYTLPGFEFACAVALALAMARIAYNDKQSAAGWGAVTLVIEVVSLYTVPLPYLRLLFSGMAAFVLMILYKLALDK